MTMKTVRAMAVLASAGMATLAGSARGEWQPTTGPWGGDVTAIAVAGHSPIAFSAAWNRVHASDDGGRTWRLQGKVPAASAVTAMLVHNDRLLAQSGQHGVWMSEDKGASWTPVELGARFPVTIAATPRAMFIALSTGYLGVALLKSDDGGASWVEVATPELPGAVFASGDAVFLNTGTGVQRSLDDGWTWHATTLSGELGAIGRRGDELYGYDSRHRQVHRSADGGLTWSPGGAGLPAFFDVTAMGSAGADLFAAVSTGAVHELYRAAVGGAGGGGMWTRVGQTPAPHPIEGLTHAIGGWEDRLLLGTRGDVLASTDRAERFERSSAGINATSPRKMIASGSTVVVATHFSPRVHWSQDDGAGWKFGTVGSGRGEVHSLAPLPGGAVLAGTGSEGVFRSNDGGQSWVASSAGLPQFDTPAGRVFERVDHVVSSPGVAMAALGITYFLQGNEFFLTQGGVYRSLDGGATWSAARSGLPTGGHNSAGQLVYEEVGALAFAGGHHWAQTYKGLFRSGNAGATWSKFDQGLTVCGTARAALGSIIEVNGDVLGAVKTCHCVCGLPAGVYRWTPGSPSWMPSGTGLPQIPIQSMVKRGTDLYVATGYGTASEFPGTGIYRSIDGGHTWARLGPGLGDLSADVLAASDESLFAGVWNGGVLRMNAPDPVAACYANCDGSTGEPALNVGDFACFLQKFAAGDAYANCDGSAGQPALSVADFTCFLTRFAAGCP